MSDFEEDLKQMCNAHYFSLDKGGKAQLTRLTKHIEKSLSPYMMAATLALMATNYTVGQKIARELDK